MVDICGVNRIFSSSMRDNDATQEDAGGEVVIVLIEIVQNEGGPPIVPAPYIARGENAAKLAEAVALGRYDADAAASGWCDSISADAARERWRKKLLRGEPVPLNCRTSLRWRAVRAEEG